MGLKVEDMIDSSRFREIISVPYSELVSFVLDYMRRKTWLTVVFWSACLIMLVLALAIRFNIAGYFHFRLILLHSSLGLIFLPMLLIPVHEILHVVPFLLTGARRIRAGADLRQYIFYVTAHRHVAGAGQFIFVAIVPFILINAVLIILILLLPGLWKWSLSLLLFVHTTMCAGDFAMVNFFIINGNRKIYTWDDADEKRAYFYEEL